MKRDFIKVHKDEDGNNVKLLKHGIFDETAKLLAKKGFFQG